MHGYGVSGNESCSEHIRMKREGNNKRRGGGGNKSTSSRGQRDSRRQRSPSQDGSTSSSQQQLPPISQLTIRHSNDASGYGSDGGESMGSSASEITYGTRTSHTDHTGSSNSGPHCVTRMPFTGKSSFVLFYF